MVLEKEEVERKYKEKVALRLAQEEAKSKRQTVESKKLKEVAENWSQDHKNQGLAGNKAKHERWEAEDRRTADEESKQKQIEITEHKQREEARVNEEKRKKDLIAKKEKERLTAKKDYEESSSEIKANRKDQRKPTFQTPAELEAQYKEFTDYINLQMNEEFYKKMTQKIQECALTGDYIRGTFMSQHLYLLFTDLIAMSQNSADVARNRRVADNFKNARDEMLMYYCSDKGASCTLPAILKKCELYYSQTETRIINSKN